MCGSDAALWLGHLLFGSSMDQLVIVNTVKNLVNAHFIGHTAIASISFGITDYPKWLCSHHVVKMGKVGQLNFKKQTNHSALRQRFSNWGPRTKGGPRRVPTGSVREFRKVVIVCTIFNNLRPICFQICTHKSVTQSQCIAWKCCRLARQAFC